MNPVVVIVATTPLLEPLPPFAPPVDEPLPSSGLAVGSPSDAPKTSVVSGVEESINGPSPGDWFMTKMCCKYRTIIFNGHNGGG